MTKFKLVKYPVGEIMCDKLIVIENLRDHIKELVEEHPCKNGGGACHCSTCTALHALSYTSGFETGNVPDEK